MIDMKDVETRKLAVSITRILHQIGMPSNLKGYRYVRTGIILAYFEPELLDRLMSGLYPRIAQEHDVRTYNVERAIRSAIELAWSRGNTNTINSIFGSTVNYMRSKPTNSEFISLITDILSLEMA